MNDSPLDSQPLDPTPAARPRRLRVSLLIAISALTAVLAFWLLWGGAPVSKAQISPLEDPQQETMPTEISPGATPTETPAPTPTETATSEPATPTAPADPEPDDLEADIPEATAETEAEEADETEPLTQTVDSLLLLPADRPVVLPDPTPPPDPMLFIGRVISSASIAATWIWFGCGSLVFFVVAGVVAGLIFAQRERDRYRIYEVVPDERPQLRTVELKEERTQADDDVWPASLP